MRERGDAMDNFVWLHFNDYERILNGDEWKTIGASDECWEPVPSPLFGKSAFEHDIADSFEWRRKANEVDLMHDLVGSARERGIERGRLEDAKARIEWLEEGRRDLHAEIQRLLEENNRLKDELLQANEKAGIQLNEKQALIRRIGRELEKFQNAALERNTTVNISIDSDKIAEAVERGIRMAGWSSSTLGPGRG